MMNAVLHHDPVTDRLKWPPCEYFGKNIGVVFLTIHMLRGHYVPVAECLHSFLTTVDVFELRFVGGPKAENPGCIVVHFQCEGEEEGHSHFLCHIG